MAKKWEYKVVSEELDRREQEAELNGRGEEGWELVCVTTTQYKATLYLKRPLSTK